MCVVVVLALQSCAPRPMRRCACELRPRARAGGERPPCSPTCLSTTANAPRRAGASDPCAHCAPLRVSVSERAAAAVSSTTRTAWTWTAP